MILLDTCTLLWLANDQSFLSEKAKNLLNSQALIYVSAISAWEIGLKIQKKKLVLPFDLRKWFMETLTFYSITEIPVDTAIAFASAELPFLHNDPADRLIIASALQHNLTVLTPDQHITQYKEVPVAW